MRQFSKIANLIKDQRGYILATVVVIVVILAMMISTVSILALSDVRQTKLWQDKSEAFYLAESGVNYAVHQIVDQGTVYENQKYLVDPPNETSEACLGTDYFDSRNQFKIWVETQDDGSTVKITSKGISNKVTKVVHQELRYIDDSSNDADSDSDQEHNDNGHHYGSDKSDDHPNNADHGDGNDDNGNAGNSNNGNGGNGHHYGWYKHGRNQDDSGQDAEESYQGWIYGPWWEE